MKSRETEYVWEDKSVPRIKLQEQMNQDEGQSGKREIGIVAPNKRLSLEEEQFVDALTSPMQKPKDWDDRLERNEAE